LPGLRVSRTNIVFWVSLFWEVLAGELLLNGGYP
jgi:hypothetical protein